MRPDFSKLRFWIWTFPRLNSEVFNRTDLADYITPARCCDSNDLVHERISAIDEVKYFTDTVTITIRELDG